MEELLQNQKTKTTGYDRTLNGQRTKNSFFSCDGLRNYFLPTHFVNPVQDYYICKPIAGLLITSVNFFQDESVLYCASVLA